MRNERGFSMSGALIGAALVGITFIAMSTMLQGLQQQRLALEGKFQTLKLEQQLSNLIKTPNFCHCNFSGQLAGKKISFDSLTPPTTLNVNYPLVMTDGACGSATTVVAAGQSLEPSSQLLANAVRFNNVLNIGPSLYMADLQIDYRWQNNNIALNSTRLPGVILATSSDGGSSVKVDSCSLTTASPSTVGAHGFISSSSPASIPTTFSLVILSGTATGMLDSPKNRPFSDGFFWRIASMILTPPKAHAADASSAGGFLFKDSAGKWFAKLYSGSYSFATNQFEVTAAQRCTRTGGYAVCARLNGSSLQITTGNQVTMFYVAL